MSAHADQDELHKWLDHLEAPPRHTYVVHGEPAASAALVEHVRGRGWNASAPAYGDEVPLE